MAASLNTATTLGLPLLLKLQVGFLMTISTAGLIAPNFTYRLLHIKDGNRALGFTKAPPDAKNTQATEDEEKLTRSEVQLLTNLSISGLAISLVYLGSAYTRQAENQVMHAAVPIRLAVVAITSLGFLINPDGRDVIKLGMIVNDLVGAVTLGLYLGTFAGRPPGYVV